MEFFPITPSALADFLEFFDCAAFEPDDEWAGCYCLEGSCDRHFEISFTDRETRREIASRLVSEGKLGGYILRENGRDIGWVKLVDKLDLEAFRDWYHGEMPKNRGEVASLYCIDLIPQYRGRGIAREILDFAMRTSKAKGFKYLEAYPAADLNEKRNYRGHSGMYKAAGFEVIGSSEDFLIMRKKLD